MFWKAEKKNSLPLLKDFVTFHIYTYANDFPDVCIFAFSGVATCLTL